MMEYRSLPHGSSQEKLSVLGLGMGGIHVSPEAEIEAVVRTAMENGVNFFDLCGGGAGVYAPFGRAIAGQREKVFFQLHFGAVYSGGSRRSEPERFETASGVLLGSGGGKGLFHHRAVHSRGGHGELRLL